MMPAPRDEHSDEDSPPDPGPPTEANPENEIAPTLTHPPGGAAPAPGKTVSLPAPAGMAGGALPEQFGRYRIQKTLGYGGMGSVYLAHDTQLQRRVALKVPFINETNGPRVLARFRREAQSAATLVHPNICPVYDVGEIDGIHYLTMAFIEGKPLSSMIPRDKGIDQVQAADFAYRIALALEEAHQKGIIHRDLKPSNVMVNTRGEPVIMDFGLAYLNGESDGRITQSGVPLGTPCYMDPDQLSGDEGDSVSPTRDIYSLGVLLYEMVTGKLPFTGKTVPQILARAIVEEPASPRTHRPDLDPRLEAIILKCMQKKPADRPPSMAAVAEALEPVVWSDLTVRKGMPRSRTMTSYDLPKVAVSKETPPDEFPSQWPTMEFDREKKAGGKPGAAPSRSSSGEGKGGQSSRAIAGVVAALLVVGLIGAAVVLLQGPKVEDPEPIVVDPTPVTPAPPAPEKGTIALRLSAPDAAALVQVDDKTVTAQSPLSLSVGQHRLRIEGADIDPVDQYFEVRAGANPDLSVSLVTYGSMQILEADPGVGVVARLDGKPIDPALLTQPRRLTTGTHTVSLEGKDITTVAKKFEIVRGANPTPKITIEGFGTIRLVGDAIDADGNIKLDGKVIPRDAAIRPLRLPVGMHLISITGEYADPVDETFRIVRGENPPLKLETKFYGEIALTLKPVPKGAEVQVNDKPVAGFRPDQPLRLPVGKHHVRITAAGFQPYEQDLILKRGVNPTRVVTLERIDPLAVKAKKFKNLLDMEMVRIEAGTAHLGSPADEKGHRENEEPRTQKVKAFYLGVHEVTVAAFREFARDADFKTEAEKSGKGAWRYDTDEKRLVQDPKCTWKTPGWKQADDEPVVCLTWQDTQAFCAWLSKHEGHKYRLPTEAEWEYACRAGSKTPFHFGDSLDATQANFDGAKPYGKGEKGPARQRTVKVGTFKPNDWGLYDMHGNVWEWCSDVYRTTPTSPPRGVVEHVIRGGSWFDSAAYCRSAYRSFDEPSLCSPNLGFRVVCEIKE